MEGVLLWGDKTASEADIRQRWRPLHSCAASALTAELPPRISATTADGLFEPLVLYHICPSSCQRMIPKDSKMLSFRHNATYGVLDFPTSCAFH